MLKFLLPAILLVLPASAQLTTQQKLLDFQQLAAIYAKNYEPYSWKHDVIGFDLYDVKPWLDQVAKTKDDLSFYDLCVRYVASLQDSHDEFTLPSDFQAYLYMRVDIYDGVVLIDFISRTVLPSSRYPFQVGDELVSVDGKPVADLIRAQIPYAANGSGNPSTARRLAADAITLRSQFFFPRAHEVGDSAKLVVKRQNGDVETYDVPWRKFGTPLINAGYVPQAPSPSSVFEPGALASTGIRQNAPPERSRRSPRHANQWGAWDGPAMRREVSAVPEYLKPLQELQTMEALLPAQDTASFGAFTPVFAPPTGFRLRLGALQSDQFLSGTFQNGRVNVGFIRISTMSPLSSTLALQQFRTEMTYFNQNTDALVIDVMGNGGGNLCYTENLEQYLIPHPFRSVAYEVRATSFWVQVYSGLLQNAISSNADKWVIDVFRLYLDAMKQTLSLNRASTGNLPICGPTFENIQPFADAAGNNLAYKKPILVLVDGLTLSAGETFSMILQDEKRATIFGVRTDGGGGNPGSYNATTYSEGNTRATRTLITRGKDVKTPGFPASHYIENTGVYPDIINDYMTKDNLLTGGDVFVKAILSAVNDLVAPAP